MRTGRQGFDSLSPNGGFFRTALLHHCPQRQRLVRRVLHRVQRVGDKVDQHLLHPVLVTPGENLARLNARSPRYNARIAEFILQDPLKPHRERLVQRLHAAAALTTQRDLFA